VRAFILSVEFSDVRIDLILIFLEGGEILFHIKSKICDVLAHLFNSLDSADSSLVHISDYEHLFFHVGFLLSNSFNFFSRILVSFSVHVGCLVEEVSSVDEVAGLLLLLILGHS